MQRDQLSEVKQLLNRAASGVDAVAASQPTVEVAKRPSFLTARAENDPQPIIERLAGAARLTFVVGAGASMEAGLPSWAELVRSVLESTAPRSLGESDRAAWVDALSEAGLLGMAATARALAGSDPQFVRRVTERIYRGKAAEDFDPGPLARELAIWKRAFPEVRLATFNYDQLLERALEDEGVTAEPRENNAPEPGGFAVVRHLHGVLTGDPAKDAVVLTEGDYALWRAGGWQDEFMRDALDGVCVFVGLSFTDQNLLRWIYGASGTQHVAVLTRQGAPSITPAVREALESATRARLTRAHVTAYWADFYAEVAQLMHEARRRRGPGAPPRPYLQRAQRRGTRGRRRCLPSRSLEARQRRVRRILVASLAGVRGALDRVGVDPGSAGIGLGLWGLGYDRREITLWGSSDRLHVDLSTVKGIPLVLESDWVAMEAVTRGAVVEWDPDVYASRWRSVRGIPLVWRGSDWRERIIVGAATLTTTEPSGSSIFDEAEAAAPGLRKTIDLALHDQLVHFWD